MLPVSGQFTIGAVKTKSPDMAVILSFLLFFHVLAHFTIGAQKSGEISGCSAHYLHFHPSDVRSENIQSTSFTLPKRVSYYHHTTEYQYDLESKMQLPADLKQFTAHCETVYIISGREIENLTLSSLNFEAYIRGNFRLKEDHFVFAQKSYKSFADTVSSMPLIQRFRFLHFSSNLARHHVNSEATAMQTSKGYSARSVRQDLNGQRIRVAIFVVEPYIILEGGKPVGGYFYNIIKESSKFYNYTAEVDHPPFKGIVQLPNKTWIGQIGQVVSGEKDLLLGSGHTYDRNAYLDFSSYVDYAGLYFVTSFPNRKVEWAAVLFIFQPSVWITLLAVCVILTVLFYLFIVLKAPYLTQKIYHSLDITFRPLLEMETTGLPNLVEVQWLAIWWMFSCLLLLNYYKMDFLAYVTFPQEEQTPRTFHELAHRHDYTIKLFFINGAASAFFNRTTNPVYSSIRSRFLRERNKVACLSSAAFSPKTACIVWDMINEVHTAKNLSLNAGFLPYETSRDASLTVAMSLALTKDSKYSESMNKIGGFLRDTGHIQKWKSEAYEIRRKEGRAWLLQSEGSIYFALKNLMSKRMSAGFKELEFENVMIGFLQVFFGLTLASLAFLYEIWPYLHIKLNATRYRQTANINQQKASELPLPTMFIMNRVMTLPWFRK